MSLWGSFSFKRPQMLLPPPGIGLLYVETIPHFVAHAGFKLCSMKAGLLGFLSCLVPTASKPQRKSRRESTLGYKLIGPLAQASY